MVLVLFESEYNLICTCLASPVFCFCVLSRVRLIDRMAYIGPRLRELQIIPYYGHTYA